MLSRLELGYNILFDNLHRFSHKITGTNSNKYKGSVQCLSKVGAEDKTWPQVGILIYVQTLCNRLRLVIEPIALDQ